MSFKYLVHHNNPSSFLHQNFQVVQIKEYDKLISLETDLISQEENDGIILGSILEEIEMKNVGQFLKNISSRLVKGSRILISGTDCVEVSRVFSNGDMTIQKFNEMIMLNRKSIWSLITIETMMEQIGIKTIVKQFGGIGNCQYSYVGEKI